MKKSLLILDFGSQLTQVIARRLRELQFYCEILPFDTAFETLKAKNPAGFILSGGPSSVYEKGAPLRNVKELSEIAPLLGICYGMQLIAKDFGGQVHPSETREYGFQLVNWSESFGSLPKEQKVWMSHGDIVEKVPPGFEIVATSKSGHPAAMKSQGQGKTIWAVQFHPEVSHTQEGEKILDAFARNVCGLEPNWSAPAMLKALSEQVQTQVGKTDHVLVGLSGGVDSSVVATLLTNVLGKERVHCVFVDNGLLRKNEYQDVLANYKKIGLNVRGVDASHLFLRALAGLSDPEQKRKAIGRVFIEVFDEAIRADQALAQIKWLAQGTLYPDVIESVSAKGGPSHVIKSHHNVGGLPEKMNLKLLEPVRELFKDEVRALGAELGLAKEMLWRHPFPGPGLSIRVMGEVTAEALHLVREADAVFIQKLREHNLYHKIWQAFCVLLPVKTVGVMGDRRTYENVLALRAVTSTDGMTADWYPFEFSFLAEVSNEITNRVRGINRVVYDVTSKPPATIEWE